ncbi:MAG: hypothetical protein ACU0D1_01925 [Pseudooceanicola nanhaiensis]
MADAPRKELKRGPALYLGRAVSLSRTRIRRLLPVPQRRRCLPAPGSSRPHWVVCFYGVERSLKYTAYGIHRHIFRPLERAGVDVTVVAHFNHIERIGGDYSREGGVRFDRDRVACLNPDLLWVERQHDAAIATELEGTEGVPWIIDTPLYANSKWNLLHQLHSLSRVADMIDTAGLSGADVFCALRADLQYIDDLDVAGIGGRIASGEADLITPDWQRWIGLNDRFAFLGSRALGPVMRRREAVIGFTHEHGHIHAESLLRDVARDADLKLGFTPMRAERVRGTGWVRHEPFHPH